MTIFTKKVEPLGSKDFTDSQVREEQKKIELMRGVMKDLNVSNDPVPPS